MRNSISRLLAATTLACVAALATGASAQSESPGAAQPERKISRDSATRENPGQTYLQKKFGLTRAEARKRLALQGDAESLAQKLAEKYGDSFLGVDIQNQPVYQVTASVAPGADRDQILAEVPASLRSVFKVRVSKFTRRQSEDTLRRLTETYKSIRSSIWFDYSRDRFIVQLPEESLEEARKALPADLQPDTDLRKGQPSTPVQSNATSADWIYGGWNHYRVDSAGNRLHCTFAFSARDSRGQPVAATAGHCPSTRHNDQQQSGRVLTFAAPGVNYDKDTYSSVTGRSYDFKLIPIPVVSTVPEVYFFNNVGGSYDHYVYAPSDPSGPWVRQTVNWMNVYSGLYESGHLHVTNTLVNSSTSGTGNPAHPNGATRCKVGNTTGITCGVVIASSVNETGPNGTTQYGMVKVGQTTEDVIAWGGDSGGAVFTEPVWNSTYGRYEITAAGIVSGASYRWVHPMKTSSTDAKRPCHEYNDGNCEMNYMPIDRINDFEPAQILLRSGASATAGKTP